MKAVPISKDIYWVGGIDWDIRSFHGYLTPRGSTYNAYLIIDEKITLVDTVKHYLYDEMLKRISSVIDPSKIDYIVVNHVEMDHSGALPHIMSVAPNAKVVTSQTGEKGLKAHFHDAEKANQWNYIQIKTGDTLNTGKKTMTFIQTPMVHWPDNMLTYLPDEKLLFSNDAFGQHIASPERFDDEYGLDILLEAAGNYYSNIVLPYGAQVKKALDAAAGLQIDMIAPSHGLIWRKYIPEILNSYAKWANNETNNKCVIVFDSMYGSTRKIAEAIGSAFEEKSIAARLMDLSVSHHSEVMPEILTAKYICVGSSTLNNNMLPPVSSFLTYMKGLAPKDRVGLAFGSYGWGGQSIGQINEILTGMGFKTMEQIKLNYVPTAEQLEGVKHGVLKELEATGL